MRKIILFYFVLLSVLTGAYLGVFYPPNALKTMIREQPSASAETNAPDGSNVSESNRLIAPTPVPHEQTPRPESTPTWPNIVAIEETPDVSLSAFNSNGVLGHLVVGKYSVLVYDNVEESTLNNGPGWMPDSSLPGDSGMSIIYGHRNRNHLKLIEHVQVGDEIVFRYLDNSTAVYVVKEVQIFEQSADWTLPISEGDSLVIVTCYPFRYSGNAPGKFQVVCVELQDY